MANSAASASPDPDSDQIMNAVQATLTWEQAVRDIAHLAELLHSLVLSIVNDKTAARGYFVSEFQQRLSEMPEGWRIAEFLWDIDQRWGHPLESAGLAFDKIIGSRNLT